VRGDEGVVSRVLARIEACEIGDFGFHKWFSKTSLDVLPLGIAPISACVLGSPHVRTIAAELGPALDVAVLGWLDDVVLMVPFVSEGASSGLKEAALFLDDYEPEQAGSSALLITNAAWRDLLLVGISFSDDTIEFTRMHREDIPMPSYRMPPLWRYRPGVP